MRLNSKKRRRQRTQRRECLSLTPGKAIIVALCAVSPARAFNRLPLARRAKVVQRFPHQWTSPLYMAAAPSGIESAIVPANSGSETLLPWLSDSSDFADDVEDEIEELEFTLIDHGIDVKSVQNLVENMYDISRGEGAMLSAIVRFLRLFLDVFKHRDPSQTYIILLASVYHVAECLHGRKAGMTSSRIRSLLQGGNGQLLSQRKPCAGEESQLLLQDSWTPCERTGYLLLSEGSASRKEDDELDLDDIVLNLSKATQRIKRAEILAEAALGNRVRSRDEAHHIRDWLLSTMTDWRALTIRVTACLFRLEGIRNLDHSARSPLTIRQAKEGLYVYAPLAERLGLNRLKMRIEERSFELLYRRQHSVVASLYANNQHSMQVLSNFLNSKISAALREDTSLMDQLQEFQVSSRVKGAFSFWKKILKKRVGPQPEHVPKDDTLSTSNVHDGIALRVVFQAKQWEDDESVERVRAREAFLCYYIQNLVRKKWPEIEQSKMKDYVRYPKPNGYQSLHYTSSIACNGADFPFEVQVRSKEMHRIAEHGVASHWEYKLGNQLAPSATSQTPLLLPPPQQTTESSENLTLLKSANAESASDYVTALETARDNLTERVVYVFVVGEADPAEGRLLSLPTGSTVGDVLEAAYSSSYDRDALILQNGQPSSPHVICGNGDVLMVSTPL